MFQKNITFHGKHADYLRRLAPSRIAGANFTQRQTIFLSNLDVVLAASIIGFVYNRKTVRDKDGDIPPNNILLEQLTTIQDQLELNYRLIMVLDNQTELSKEERINKAFRYDRNEEKRKPGDEVFWAYLRGGIEVLYEKLLEGSTSTDEDIQKTYDFITEYSKVFGENISMDDIYKLCNEASV